MQVKPGGGPPRLSRTGRYGSPVTSGARTCDWSSRRLRPPAMGADGVTAKSSPWSGPVRPLIGMASMGTSSVLRQAGARPSWTP
eukprot:9330579-Alexandrium_andersonii.AAC.1